MHGTATQQTINTRQQRTHRQQLDRVHAQLLEVVQLLDTSRLETKTLDTYLETLEPKPKQTTLTGSSSIAFTPSSLR